MQGGKCNGISFPVAVTPLPRTLATSVLGGSKQHSAILQPMVKPYVERNVILDAFMFLPPPSQVL